MSPSNSYTYTKAVNSKMVEKSGVSEKNSLCPRQDSFTYIKTVSSKMVEETGVPNEIITIQMI